MSHFKQYQKPIDTKKERNQTTELQTRLHTIKNVLDSSLEPKFKKKQNTNILTRKRTHSAKKTKILWSSEASHLDPPSLFSTIWAESCIFYKTMLIKECVCRFFTKSCSIPKSEQKCFFLA